MQPYRTILLIVLFFQTSLIAQNLVQNGDFEQHGPISTLERGERFGYTLPHWKGDITFAPFICDTTVKRDEDQIKYRICPYEVVKPYQGKVMVEMEYSANAVDGKLHRGNGPTLTTKLKEPLEHGKLYQVSFWLYIHEPNDPEYIPHIGFQLYPKAVRNPSIDLLEGSPFLLSDSSTVVNQWFQASWIVRPICRLNFLAIGVFRNSKGPGEKYSKLVDNQYFIDDVSAVEIPQNPLNDSIAKPFCFWEESESLPEEIEPVTCYFSTGDSILTQSEITKLDSFAKQALLQPKTTFYLFGHTDSIGSNHTELAGARIRATLQYLQKKGVPNIRFITLPKGKDQPALSNITEDNRVLNRRVEIKQSGAEVHQVIYRQMLDSIAANQMLPAGKLLRKWIRLTPERNLLFAFHDPRLAPLHTKDAESWKLFENALNKTYQIYEKKECAQSLESLFIADQWYRTFSGYLNQLPAYFPEIDSLENRYYIDFPISDEKLFAPDSQNYVKLLQHIQNCGYPNRTDVGKRAAKTAFLILQHHPELSARKHWLPIIYEKCMEGEAEWIYYAALFDRIAIESGLPQRYGTQYKPAISGKETLFPLENPEMVDQWRKSIGLAPLQF